MGNPLVWHLSLFFFLLAACFVAQGKVWSRSFMSQEAMDRLLQRAQLSKHALFPNNSFVTGTIHGKNTQTVASQNNGPDSYFTLQKKKRKPYEFDIASLEPKITFDQMADSEPDSPQPKTIQTVNVHRVPKLPNSLANRFSHGQQINQQDMISANNLEVFLMPIDETRNEIFRSPGAQSEFRQNAPASSAADGWNTLRADFASRRQGSPNRSVLRKPLRIQTAPPFYGKLTLQTTVPPLSTPHGLPQTILRTILPTPQFEDPDNLGTLRNPQAGDDLSTSFLTVAQHNIENSVVMANDPFSRQTPLMCPCVQVTQPGNNLATNYVAPTTPSSATIGRQYQTNNFAQMTKPNSPAQNYLSYTAPANYSQRPTATEQSVGLSSNSVTSYTYPGSTGNQPNPATSALQTSGTSINSNYPGATGVMSYPALGGTADTSQQNSYRPKPQLPQVPAPIPISNFNGNSLGMTNSFVGGANQNNPIINYNSYSQTGTTSAPESSFSAPVGGNLNFGGGTSVSQIPVAGFAGTMQTLNSPVYSSFPIVGSNSQGSNIFGTTSATLQSNANNYAAGNGLSYPLTEMGPPSQGPLQTGSQNSNLASSGLPSSLYQSSGSPGATQQQNSYQFPAQTGIAPRPAPSSYPSNNLNVPASGTGQNPPTTSYTSNSQTRFNSPASAPISMSGTSTNFGGLGLFQAPAGGVSNQNSASQSYAPSALGSNSVIIAPNTNYGALLSSAGMAINNYPQNGLATGLTSGQSTGSSFQMNGKTYASSPALSGLSSQTGQATGLFQNNAYNSQAPGLNLNGPNQLIYPQTGMGPAPSSQFSNVPSQIPAPSAYQFTTSSQNTPSFSNGASGATAVFMVNPTSSPGGPTTTPSQWQPFKPNWSTTVNVGITLQGQSTQILPISASAVFTGPGGNSGPTFPLQVVNVPYAMQPQTLPMAAPTYVQAPAAFTNSNPAPSSNTFTNSLNPTWSQSQQTSFQFNYQPATTVPPTWSYSYPSMNTFQSTITTPTSITATQSANYFSAAPATSTNSASSTYTAPNGNQVPICLYGANQVTASPGLSSPNSSGGGMPSGGTNIYTMGTSNGVGNGAGSLISGGIRNTANNNVDFNMYGANQVMGSSGGSFMGNAGGSSGSGANLLYGVGGATNNNNGVGGGPASGNSGGSLYSGSISGGNSNAGRGSGATAAGIGKGGSSTTSIFTGGGAIGNGNYGGVTGTASILNNGGSSSGSGLNTVGNSIPGSNANYNPGSASGNLIASIGNGVAPPGGALATGISVTNGNPSQPPITVDIYQPVRRIMSMSALTPICARSIVRVVLDGGTQPGSRIGTVLAADPGAGSLIWQIDGDPTGVFTINNATGDFGLAKPLNGINKASVIIRATNAAGLFCTTRIEIQVARQQSQSLSSWFSQQVFNTTIPCSLPPGALILQIPAQHPTGDMLTYLLQGSDEFVINGTGHLTVGKVDISKRDGLRTFEVVATDSQGIQVRAIVNVKLDISTCYGPQFDMSAYLYDVVADCSGVRPGDQIAQITALSSSPPSQLAYNLVGVVGFNIDPMSGIISALAPISISQRLPDFGIVVTDTYGRNDRAIVRISVIVNCTKPTTAVIRTSSDSLPKNTARGITPQSQLQAPRLLLSIANLLFRVPCATPNNSVIGAVNPGIFITSNTSPGQSPQLMFQNTSNFDISSTDGHVTTKSTMPTAAGAFNFPLTADGRLVGNVTVEVECLPILPGGVESLALNSDVDIVDGDLEADPTVPSTSSTFPFFPLAAFGV